MKGQTVSQSELKSEIKVFWTDKENTSLVYEKNFAISQSYFTFDAPAVATKCVYAINEGVSTK